MNLVNENPKRLLDQALSLIALDLKHIQDLVIQGKLDNYASQDLARYSSSLLAIAKSHEKDDEDQLKTLSKLPYEELVKMAQEAIGNYDSDSSKTSKRGW